MDSEVMDDFVLSSSVSTSSSFWTVSAFAAFGIQLLLNRKSYCATVKFIENTPLLNKRINQSRDPKR